MQRYFDKVEADRQAIQARIDAEKAAKAAAEAEARKAAGGDKPAEESTKDEEMTDADAPKAEVEEPSS